MGLLVWTQKGSENGLLAIAQELQLGTVEDGQMARVHVLLHVNLDACQPIRQRMGRGQGSRSVVGEDAPALGRITRRQIVVVAFAGQLRAGLGTQHNCIGVDRHTASQQIRVSEVGQEGEPYPGGQIQRGEEIVPEQVIVVAGVAGIAQLKTGTGRLCRLADEVAVAADVDKERTGLPVVHTAAGRGQESQHQHTIQLAVQGENAVRGEAPGQQSLGHGALVVVHGGFIGRGCGDEEGEVVGVHGLIPALPRSAHSPRHCPTLAAGSADGDPYIPRWAGHFSVPAR